MNNMVSLFIMMKYNEDPTQKVDVKGLDPKMMSKYVIDRMTATGYNISMLRVNPSEWGYQDITNLVLKYESEGYEISMLVLDYLPLVTLKGCDMSGAGGTANRDQFRRVRAVMSAKDITVITPGQLNPAARSLLLNGVDDRDFLETIAERGMYSNSSQLSQEFDIGVLIHIITSGEDCYLQVLVEKHRTPISISANLKSFILQFPNNGMPIPDNIHDKTHRVLRKVPNARSNTNGAQTDDIMDMFT